MRCCLKNNIKESFQVVRVVRIEASWPCGGMGCCSSRSQAHMERSLSFGVMCSWRLSEMASVWFLDRISSCRPGWWYSVSLRLGMSPNRILEVRGVSASLNTEPESHGRLPQSLVPYLIPSKLFCGHRSECNLFTGGPLTLYGPRVCVWALHKLLISELQISFGQHRPLSQGS